MGVSFWVAWSTAPAILATLLFSNLCTAQANSQLENQMGASVRPRTNRSMWTLLPSLRFPPNTTTSLKPQFLIRTLPQSPSDKKPLELGGIQEGSTTVCCRPCCVSPAQRERERRQESRQRGRSKEMKHRPPIIPPLLYGSMLSLLRSGTRLPPTVVSGVCSWPPRVLTSSTA